MSDRGLEEGQGHKFMASCYQNDLVLLIEWGVNDWQWQAENTEAAGNKRIVLEDPSDTTNTLSEEIVESVCVEEIVQFLRALEQ